LQKWLMSKSISACKCNQNTNGELKYDTSGQYVNFFTRQIYDIHPRLVSCTFKLRVFRL